MYPGATVRTALALARGGMNASAVSAELDVSRSTIRDWIAGMVPHSAGHDVCQTCYARHDLLAVPAEYLYVLGLYLSDGCLSAHRGVVSKLRIALDQRYPEIVTAATDAVRTVSGHAVVRHRADGCVEVYSYWRPWPCLLPQHGPGKKHDRPIVLTDWQERLVDADPQPLIRGLIQSDGCRFQNTGRGGWSAPRYSFTNRSSDIHIIFQRACDRIGVRWTVTAPKKTAITYVSRQADVAALDAFIGPKR